jgi:hypothetical protein
MSADDVYALPLSDGGISGIKLADKPIVPASGVLAALQTLLINQALQQLVTRLHIDLKGRKN